MRWGIRRQGIGVVDVCKNLRIAIVSPYPPPQLKHVYGSGVASYTKNFAAALQNVGENIKIHVIANKIDDLPPIYMENKVFVHRVYTQNLLYVFQIFNTLRKLKPDVVHIQHEYFLYGGPISALLFPVLVVLSKLISKKVLTTLHGVIPLRLIEDKEFRKENGISGPAFMLKIGLFIVTKLILIFSDKIIVHENFLKEYIMKDYKERGDKIIVIPHGVEDVKPIPQNKAKNELKLENKFIILYFGYLTGYKGLNEILDVYKEITEIVPDTVLIIAGGLHPRLANKRWYVKWVYELIKKGYKICQGKEKCKVIFTGYLPEEKIPLFFSACDIIVLPYKARIAASGPEALAISFEKCYILPSVIHSNIKEYIKENLIAKIKKENEIRECINYVKKLKMDRNWTNIARKYLMHLCILFRSNYCLCLR